MRADDEKKGDGVRVHHKRKIDGVEFIIRKRVGVRVHHKKER